MTENPRTGGAPARKPTVEELGLAPDALRWRRSGGGTPAEGASGVEVAFAGDWVLLRTGDDPGALISVFDHHEWDCFLAGAKAAEFDRAAS